MASCGRYGKEGRYLEVSGGIAGAQVAGGNLFGGGGGGGGGEGSGGERR